MQYVWPGQHEGGVHDRGEYLGWRFPTCFVCTYAVSAAASRGRAPHASRRLFRYRIRVVRAGLVPAGLYFRRRRAGDSNRTLAAAAVHSVTFVVHKLPRSAPVPFLSFFGPHCFVFFFSFCIASSPTALFSLLAAVGPQARARVCVCVCFKVSPILILATLARAAGSVAPCLCGFIWFLAYIHFFVLLFFVSPHCRERAPACAMCCGFAIILLR